MPLNDSLPEDAGPSEQRFVPISEQDVEAEEIETPIETGVQAQAEREFETERKIPCTCTKAIVSVNGRDVDEVLLPDHSRAA